jgi:hypothetical protein
MPRPNASLGHEPHRSTLRLRPIVSPCLLVPALLCVFASGVSAQTEGDYLYTVTMLRAAPGHFQDLVSTLEAQADLMESVGDLRPFAIRHSQGDQWDFMLIFPMEDFSTFYGHERAERRTTALESREGRELAARLEAYTSYHEEWLARSVGVEEMRRRFRGSGLFHVEMFAGLAGSRAELLGQRRMENRYYEHLERQQNLLFVREAGSNWDAMTIGFYESLQAYAAAGAHSSTGQQEEAARAAGFEGVDQISPYLRSLLAYHHDTLGVPLW